MLKQQRRRLSSCFHQPKCIFPKLRYLQFSKSGLESVKKLGAERGELYANSDGLKFLFYAHEIEDRFKERVPLVVEGGKFIIGGETNSG